MDNAFYGDSFRWFLGIVESNADPLQLGRVRVRIHGLHTENQVDIDTSDLPWAQTLLPATEQGISGVGRSSLIQPGALVFGMFFDGEESQIPIVLGTMSRIEYASAVQRQNLEDDRLNRRTEPSSAPPGTGSTGRRNRIVPSDPEGVGAVGGSNAEKAFNYFLAYGFTDEQSAGIVGNLMQESGPELSTTVESAGAERSFGIAQWNSAEAAGNRLGELKEFASDLGRDWTDLDVQLQFITYELEKYPYLGLADLRAARTIEQAVIAFETKYERPSSPYRERRIAYAKDAYVRFA